MSELMAIDLSKQMIHSKFTRVELARIYSPTASECYTTHHLHKSVQLYIIHVLFNLDISSNNPDKLWFDFTVFFGPSVILLMVDIIVPCNQMLSVWSNENGNLPLTDFFTPNGGGEK